VKAAAQVTPVQGAVNITGTPSVGATVGAQLVGPAAQLVQQTPGATVQYAWRSVSGQFAAGPSTLVPRQLGGSSLLLEARVTVPGYTTTVFTSTTGIAPRPSNVFIQQVIPQGAQRLVVAQADLAGYASGSNLRYEWFRNGQLVNVTGGPQAQLPSSPSGTEFRVVQVVQSPGFPEHRLNAVNRIIVQGNNWVLTGA
jgi:hypothetical protein